MQTTIMPLQEIDSDADFIVYSEDYGLLSEHCTMGEAQMAYLREASRRSLGQELPTIYERQEPHWVPLS